MRWHFLRLTPLIAKSLHSPANVHFSSMILAVWCLPSGYIYELGSSWNKSADCHVNSGLRFCVQERDYGSELIPGDSTEIDEVTLGMLFPPGEAAGVIDQRTRTAATSFARDHGCGFLFDGQSSKSTFLKLPSRWHELIDNLCTNLGRETPGTCCATLESSLSSPHLSR
jgi:hypothetical protein